MKERKKSAQFVGIFWKNVTWLLSNVFTNNEGKSTIIFMDQKQVYWFRILRMVILGRKTIVVLFFFHFLYFCLISKKMFVLYNGGIANLQYVFFFLFSAIGLHDGKPNLRPKMRHRCVCNFWRWQCCYAAGKIQEMFILLKQHTFQDQELSRNLKCFICFIFIWCLHLIGRCFPVKHLIFAVIEQGIKLFLS